jgi:tetratricopeptide (TPR) repeat protein
LKVPTPCIAILLVLAVASMASAQTALEQADAAWERRAEGFLETGELNTEQLELALQSYEQALREDPENLDLHITLMDTLYHISFFTKKTRKEKRPYVDRALELNHSALRVLSDRVGREKLKGAKTLEERAELYKSDPSSAKIHLWCGINWGLWSTGHSNLASARHNVARKIRHHARLTILLDDQFWDAGGYRLLSRLHTDAPMVPGFTGWVDRDYGIALIRKANKISTKDLRNPYFLAQALLKFEPESKNEVAELLENVSRREPMPDELAQDTHYINLAQSILDKSEPPPKRETLFGPSTMPVE